MLLLWNKRRYTYNHIDNIANCSADEYNCICDACPNLEDSVVFDNNEEVVTNFDEVFEKVKKFLWLHYTQKTIVLFVHKTKTLLNNNSIPFEEVNIGLDPDARKFVVNEGHRTVPQLYVKGQLLVEGG